jgi:hypothetical protein
VRRRLDRDCQRGDRSTVSLATLISAIVLSPAPRGKRGETRVFMVRAVRRSASPAAGCGARRSPMGSVNAPMAVSGLPARKARIRPRVAARSSCGTTSTPPWSRVRHPRSPRCEAARGELGLLRPAEPGDAATAGKMGICSRVAPAAGRVPRGPMAAIPLTAASSPTQSTRSSTTFRTPPGARTLAISGPATSMSNQCKALPANTAATESAGSGVLMRSAGGAPGPADSAWRPLQPLGHRPEVRMSRREHAARPALSGSPQFRRPA